MCKCSEKWQDIAPLILRLALGFIFLVHGWQKISGDFFPGFLTQLSVPMPAFFAFIVTWLEFLGGIALILGLLTHLASKLLAIEMLVALFLVHIKNGFYITNGGAEFALALFAGCVALMIIGAGKFSIDAKIMKS